MDWLAHLYVGTLNMIHYMHDKYYYEAAEMALIDTKVDRSFATGITYLTSGPSTDPKLSREWTYPLISSLIITFCRGRFWQ